MPFMDIGIDLGTSSIMVYSENKGIIIEEPSIIAMDTVTREVLAFGRKAKEMAGKTPQNIAVFQPLKHGMIEEFEVTTEMLKYLVHQIKKHTGFSFRKPNIAACVPYHATQMERRAIQEAIKKTGAKNVYLIEEPIAAAIGAELPVEEPAASLIVEMGGGTTQAAILSYGGIVACHVSGTAGCTLDANILHYMKREHHLLITERIAETIKKEIGCALAEHERLTLAIKGRSIMTGLPESVEIDSYQIHQAISGALSPIMDTIQKTLESCPPELTGDIIDRGITLSGGGALLHGMEERVRQEFLLPVRLALNPQKAVAIGTGKSLPVMLKAEKALK